MAPGLELVEGGDKDRLHVVGSVREDDHPAVGGADLDLLRHVAGPGRALAPGMYLLDNFISRERLLGNPPRGRGCPLAASRVPTS